MNIKEVLKEMEKVIKMSSIERQLGLPKKVIRLYDNTPIKQEHAVVIKAYLIKLLSLANNIVLENEPISKSSDIIKDNSINLQIITEDMCHPCVEKQLDVNTYIDEDFNKVIKVKSRIEDNTKVKIITSDKKQSFGYISKQIVIDNETKLPVIYSYLVKVFLV